MEFNGQHCHLCSQLDYLPFTCPSCSNTFCLKHRLPDTHSCPCLPPPVVKEEKEEKEGKGNEKEQDKRSCLVKGCGAKGSELIVCKECGGIVCIEHRHGQDHKCPKTMMEIAIREHDLQRQKESKAALAEAQANVHKRFQEKRKKTKSSKNAEMARKVNLMKLRMKATGPNFVPEKQRIFYFVHFSEKKDVPLFGSNEWTVGQALEHFCRTSKIQNSNNDPTSPTILAIFAIVKPFEDGKPPPEPEQLSFSAKLSDIESGEDLWVEKIRRLEYNFRSVLSFLLLFLSEKDIFF